MEHFEDYAATPVNEGESGGLVYRLSKPGAAPLFLKTGSGPVADDITAEMVRTRWLGRFVSTPEVVHFVASGETARLVTSALPGMSAYDCLLAGDEPTRRRAVVAVVEFLRLLHAVPAICCPFESGHELRMQEARRNMEAGRVDEEDFGPEHEGWSAQEVWSKMEGLLPLAFERVVTHGDYSLGNICMENGDVTGFLDLGRAGVADRYQDLAILWDNLAEFGSELQELALRSYGVAEMDVNRLQFHLCLDEFF